MGRKQRNGGRERSDIGISRFCPSGLVWFDRGVFPLSAVEAFY